MSEDRLPAYLDHIQQAAADVCTFVEGLSKDDFSGRQAYPASRHHESHHHWRSRDEGDGWPCRVHPGARRSAVTQHAQHAQSHGARLFRHQSRRRLGDGAGVGPAIAQAAHRSSPRCMRAGRPPHALRTTSRRESRTRFPRTPRRSTSRACRCPGRSCARRPGSEAGR